MRSEDVSSHDRLPTDPFLCTYEAVQEFADQRIRELGGQDRDHVDCYAFGVEFRYAGPSAITYWRCIKEAAIKRASRRRASLGLADPITGLFS